MNALSRVLILVATATLTRVAVAADSFPVGPLEPVPRLAQRPEWNRFTILIWQWRTDACQDRAGIQD